MFWDTAGQEQFKALTKSYFTSVHVTMVVYDVSDRESFEKIGDWFDMYFENERNRPGDGVKDCIFYLVGNKCDLPPQ